MVQFIGSLLTSIFGTQSWLATIIISMFPIIELKGAIPLGVSYEFWGDNALSNMQAFSCSMIGSCLVVPILALIFTPIIKWMKNTRILKKLSVLIEEKIAKSSIKINHNENEKKSSRKIIFLKMLGIFLFVADPFPFTGVWTGTCVGVAIGLNFWQTVVSVVIGNLVAGLLVVFVCSAFPQFSTILFFIVLVIVLAVLLVCVLKLLFYKKKKLKSYEVGVVENLEIKQDNKLAIDE